MKRFLIAQLITTAVVIAICAGSFHYFNKQDALEIIGAVLAFSGLALFLIFLSGLVAGYCFSFIFAVLMGMLFGLFSGGIIGLMVMLATAVSAIFAVDPYDAYVDSGLDSPGFSKFLLLVIQGFVIMGLAHLLSLPSHFS